MDQGDAQFRAHQRQVMTAIVSALVDIMLPFLLCSEQAVLTAATGVVPGRRQHNA
jgi:hypothetical protein